MKSEKPEDPLSLAVQEWRISPSADPNFRPAVWAQIRAREQGTFSAYLRGHAAVLSAAAVVTLLASGWAGSAARHARIEAARDAMVVSYLVELDPRVQATVQHAP